MVSMYLQKHADAVEVAKHEARTIHGSHASPRQPVTDLQIEAPVISADAAMHSAREVKFHFIVLAHP